MLLLCIVCFVAVTFSGADIQQYSTRYDDFDIDNLIRNDRLLQKYVQCLLDLVACTVEGLELKRNMPDAIQTNCTKCSEKQKIGSDKLISFLIDNRPELWEPLEEKYDPTGEYTKRFLEIRKIAGIDSTDQSTLKFN